MAEKDLASVQILQRLERVLQRRLRDAYAALREKEPERIRVLDGSGSIEEVFARTQAAAADFLNTKE